MNFVKFIETNDHEGETWNFWLQLDGNEEQIKELETYLSKFDEFGEAYALYMTPVPESEVDILVKHSDQGYMDYENKVTGKFTCPQPPEFVNDDEAWEWLNDNFYKGDITRWFK